MEIPQTSIRIARVCWAYFWRSLVYSFLGGIALGLLGMGLAFVFKQIGLPTRLGGSAIALGTFILWIPVSYLSMRGVLKCDFDEFRVALICDEEPLFDDLKKD